MDRSPLTGSRRDSFTLLREFTRWRIALVMNIAGLTMMVALGAINLREGRMDSVRLAVMVFAVLAVCLVMLLKLPKGLGGRIYFWLTVAILVYLPFFGAQQGRTFHYWAYVLPPTLFFLMRPLPALACMALFGVYSCALLRPFMPTIDLARFGMSYGLLVAYLYTYALLEERAAAMLRYLSDRDPLTNCLNRRNLNETLAETESAAADAATCALLLIDIDHFKAINDQKGHLVGDRAITQVAAVLGRVLESGAALYRYGGEEFAVMLPGADAATGRELGERLRAAVEAADFAGLKITVSVGVAQWRARHGSAAAALDAADRALYAAKRGGRNRVEVSAP